MEPIIASLTNLRQGTTKFGPAPHKPVLILALIEAFERGHIASNHIPISPYLISFFEGIWNELVSTGHSRNFTLPFFHLKNEKGGFWKLVSKHGQIIPTTKSHSVRSFKSLLQTVRHAEISSDLYSLLISSKWRKTLKEAILSTYFNGKSLNRYNDPYVSVQNQIITEPNEAWINKEKEILENIKEPDKKAYQYYVRNSFFTEKIRRIYDGKCSISELRCNDVNLVDACHILPFNESFNNSFRNGFALTPTLHRAFDLGLLAIDDNYRVIIHPSLNENNDSPYHISQFKGKSIISEIDQKWIPSLEYFYDHRKRFSL